MMSAFIPYLRLILLLLLLLYTCVHFTSSLSHSSSYSLVTLIKYEKHVINILKKLEQKVQQRDPEKVLAAQRYIKSFEEFFANNQTAEALVQHPINYYHLYKHVTVGFNDLSNAYNKQQGIIKAYMQSINIYRNNNHFPTMVTLNTTAASLARLQYMNRIPVKDLVKGLIRNKDGKEFKSLQPLDYEDCLLIGKAALHHEYTETAIEFLEAARRLKEIEVFGVDYEITKKLDEAINWQNTYGNREDGSIENAVSPLCRGEYEKKKTIDYSLKCRYLTRSRPHLLIGPLKLEEMSREPPIMMFHNFLNDWEIERFKKIAIPHLSPSRVYNPKNFTGEIIFHRISEQTWLNDFADPTLTLSVSRRLEDATGLNTGVKDAGNALPVAEPYQVLNYGIGGLYLTHPDYVHGQDDYENERWYRMAGDRLATMLIYLSDVEVGGATVFPEAEVVVWPKRGSAAFWYNLKKSIDPDPSTLHAGCPIIHGTKWISNKWIHVKDQYNYQCSLNRSDLHEILR